jgi:hypothetical protein
LIYSTKPVRLHSIELPSKLFFIANFTYLVFHEGLRSMPYVSQNYDSNPAAQLGTWVGDPPYHGQCVSYVKAVTPALPATSEWGKGDLVKGSLNLVKGTVIATFDADGHYFGHAAIYEGQTSKGINVVDQWITPPAQPIHRRLIRFGAHGISNNGDNFYVVN